MQRHGLGDIKTGLLGTTANGRDGKVRNGKENRGAKLTEEAEDGRSQMMTAATTPCAEVPGTSKRELQDGLKRDK